MQSAQIFTNIITLSFVSFLVGTATCIFIYIFRSRQEAKEKSLIVNHYAKVKEIDAKFINQELISLKDLPLNLIEYVKSFNYTYLDFLKEFDKTNDGPPDTKFGQFVRSYISISLITLYFCVLSGLAIASTRYDAAVFLAFLNSPILEYLIQLVSIITSFSLTQRILFSEQNT